MAYKARITVENIQQLNDGRQRILFAYTDPVTFTRYGRPVDVAQDQLVTKAIDKLRNAIARRFWEGRVEAKERDYGGRV